MLDPVLKPCVLTWFLFAASLTGCVRAYAPPQPHEPHAVVKIRRSYLTSAGTSLSEYANVNEYRAMREERPASQHETRTDGLRVHPGPTRWEVGSAFAHHEMRQVRESYTEQEPYSTTESYNCGTGTSYRSCSRSVTRYRSVTKWRTVMRNVSVSDGSCSRKTSHVAAQSGVYLLQYSYSGPGECSLQCLEQRPLPDGKFEMHPCVELPPAQ